MSLCCRDKYLRSESEDAVVGVVDDVMEENGLDELGDVGDISEGERNRVSFAGGVGPGVSNGVGNVGEIVGEDVSEAKARKS
jgi:hypothetical protein